MSKIILRILNGWLNGCHQAGNLLMANVQIDFKENIGRMPMILQQPVTLDDEYLPQNSAAVIRKVKKKKPTTIIIEDYVSDSSSDSLSIESTIVIEDVPIQRPKRSKVQYQQKSSNINK